MNDSFTPEEWWEFSSNHPELGSLLTEKWNEFLKNQPKPKDGIRYNFYEWMSMNADFIKSLSKSHLYQLINV